MITRIVVLPRRERRRLARVPARQDGRAGNPGTNAPGEIADLTPHTPPWFAVLNAINPQQAAMTRAALRMAGRANVCSVCGDSPAPVYAVEGGLPLAFRLCGDCVALQWELHGQRVRALGEREPLGDRGAGGG